jgi:uncharacterized protein (DUF1015 family)
MAQIRPFAGIRYSAAAGADQSDFIAPPYDVLDAAGKARLLAKSPFNIVAIDLPHVPPKQLGPPAAYEAAAATMTKWLDSGVLVRGGRRATYAYEQTYDLDGHPHHRRGIIVLVKLTPFGVDVIPHEKTYAGPIEDRLQLMHATGAQLSPVFGLFMDRGDAILSKVFASVSKPACTAALDGVSNKLWEVTDASLEDELQIAMRDKKIYIADGHHRYTTALHYQRQMEEKNGGPLSPPDPANWCMFVLINGEDAGLRVLPTHRLIGGLEDWSLPRFVSRAAMHFGVTPTAHGKTNPAALAIALPDFGKGAIGVYTKEGETLVIKPRGPEEMRQLEPEKSDAWRALDVAVFQRLVFDELIAKYFAENDGTLHRGYTADASEAVAKVKSGEFQAAFLLQPTPIRALAELGEVGETMPQKSTYFFPKLATGLVINPLR